MKVTCTGRKVSLKPSFIEKAEAKLAKLDKFFEVEAQAQVTVTVEKSGHTVEVTVRGEGLTVRAEKAADRMEDALDEAMDLLTRRYPTIVQKILGAVAYLAGTVVFSYIGYLGVVKVLMGQIENNARINETLATSFPQWPFGLAYSFGFFLLGFSCLWAFVRICFGKAVAQDAVDIEAKNKELLEQAAAEAAAEEGKEDAE